MNPCIQRITDSQGHKLPSSACGTTCCVGSSRRPPPATAVQLSASSVHVQKPSIGTVCAAHADFIATLAGAPPRPIPLDADAIDLEDRALHLSKVFGALSAYLAVILDDTGQNVPDRLDLPDVEAHLSDLAADVAGLIERAAEDMRGWIA